jgi:hypothetical protein
VYGRFPKCRLPSRIALAAVVSVIGAGFVAAPARAAVTLRPRVLGVAPRGGKLSPRLSALEREPSFASPRVAARSLSLPASGAGSLVQEPGGRILVEIRTTDTSSSGVAALQALGARVVNVSPTYETVTAAVAASALDAIARDAAVAYVHEVLAPFTARVGRHAAPGTFDASANACHPTISEDNTLMHVAAARAQNEVDGSGQTIGVLSDSFNTDTGAPTRAAHDISTGDLPGPANPCGYTTPVKVQSDYSGGQQLDEGRAMIELAHGLAPGAKFAFATAANGQLDFANQVTRLRTTNHANVIVDDAQYLNEPFFQDGPVAQAENAASAAGVPVFSAAGNSNMIVGGNNVSSYETPSFRSMACPIAVTNLPSTYTGCHNFDPNGGTDNTDGITLAPGGGVGIDLQWAEPWGAVSNDYDVFLLNNSGAIIAGSVDNQSMSHEPFEFFGYTNNTASPQTVQLVIAKFSGGADSRMKFVMVGSSGINAVQYNASSGGDIVGPSIFGHNGAASVGSTAAIPYNNSNRPEDYSARGPVTQYFEPTPSTNALASPLVLQKPDFAATDNVKNVFFIEPSGGGIYRFAGTSAAAPQAAAIGALLREYDPSMTPADVMSTLRATARPVATNGAGTDVGGGYLDALAALATRAPAPRAPRITSETNGNGRVTLHWATRTGFTYPVTSSEVTPILGGVPQAPQTFGTGSTQAITGLTNGGSYRFAVHNTNANGTGPDSAPSAPLIVGQPGPPAAVTAVPGSTRATVAWKKPAVTYGLAITGYDVGVYVNNKLVSHKTVSSRATTRVVVGLKNKTHYAFAVTAINSTSRGLRSALSPVITAGAPRPPLSVTATPAHKSAKLHWRAPASNGSAITSYTVTPYVGTVAKGARVFRNAKTTQIFRGLTTGVRYTFRVAATNARGTSPRSRASKRIRVT